MDRRRAREARKANRAVVRCVRELGREPGEEGLRRGGRSGSWQRLLVRRRRGHERGRVSREGRVGEQGRSGLEANSARVCALLLPRAIWQSPSGMINLAVVVVSVRIVRVRVRVRMLSERGRRSVELSQGKMWRSSVVRAASFTVRYWSSSDVSSAPLCTTASSSAPARVAVVSESAAPTPTTASAAPRPVRARSRRCQFVRRRGSPRRLCVAVPASTSTSAGCGCVCTAGPARGRLHGCCVGQGLSDAEVRVY